MFIAHCLVGSKVHIFCDNIDMLLDWRHIIWSEWETGQFVVSSRSYLLDTRSMIAQKAEGVCFKKVLWYNLSESKHAIEDWKPTRYSRRIMSCFIFNYPFWWLMLFNYLRLEHVFSLSLDIPRVLFDCQKRNIKHNLICLGAWFRLEFFIHNKPSVYCLHGNNNCILSSVTFVVHIFVKEMGIYNTSVL